LPELKPIEPLLILGISDYHCHCDFSTDAEGSVDDYCRAAIERNLVEICFTTHYDGSQDGISSDEFIRIDGDLHPVSPDNLAPYVDVVRQAQDDYYPLGLSVKLGIEFGWYEGCEEAALRLKERFNFDYFLCGIHSLDNLCFWRHGANKGCFDVYSLEEFAERYFDQVIKAARSGLFDTIAHLDYYKRKAYSHYGDAVADIHRNYLPDVFRALIESGTSLEVNTAGVRHGLKEYYPRVDIINAAKKAGVDVANLGSDAHHPSQVGFDFEAAAALVPSRVVEDRD